MIVFRYIDQFSRCLHVEYKNKGIDVQCQVLFLSVSINNLFLELMLYYQTLFTYCFTSLYHLSCMSEDAHLVKF